jgi:hypothetical protein
MIPPVALESDRFALRAKRARNTPQPTPLSPERYVD